MATAGVAIATTALRDLKRLAQLADDGSENARGLATSTRLNLQQWKEGPNITAPDLEQLLNAQVRHSATGKRFRLWWFRMAFVFA